MDEWELFDCIDPADGPEEFPKLSIRSADQLRNELVRLARREPSIVALENRSTAIGLQIGIGGPFAGIRWGEGPYPGRGGTVLADRPYHAERIDYTSEGDTIAFWPADLIPVEQAIEIAVYYFNHHKMPDWVSWKEWNRKTKKWEIKKAAAQPPKLPTFVEPTQIKEPAT